MDGAGDVDRLDGDIVEVLLGGKHGSERTKDKEGGKGWAEDDDLDLSDEEDAPETVQQGTYVYVTLQYGHTQNSEPKLLHFLLQYFLTLFSTSFSPLFLNFFFCVFRMSLVQISSFVLHSEVPLLLHGTYALTS